MTTSYHKLFRNTARAKAPAGLSGRIMVRIEAYEVSRLRRRAFFQGALGFAALVLCVPAISYLASAIAQSGFSEYLSLAFSDGGYVLANLKDFALILADSLPATGAIAILAIGTVFFWSLRGMLVDLASLSHFRRNLA